MTDRLFYFLLQEELLQLVSTSVHDRQAVLLLATGGTV